MIGLRRYSWSLLVVAFLMAGALSALRPAGISGTPAPVRAASATSVSGALALTYSAVWRKHVNELVPGLMPAPTRHARLIAWVTEIAALTERLDDIAAAIVVPDIDCR